MKKRLLKHNINIGTCTVFESLRMSASRPTLQGDGDDRDGVDDQSVAASLSSG